MSKTVLVLGAGLVVPPLVRYLDNKGYKVIVGSRTLANAEKLTAGSKNGIAEKINVEEAADLIRLEELTQQVDAVVSMLPYLFHPVAAKIALKHNKHFLTTSYVSADMRAFDGEAKEKNLVMVNECGVDPGIDHMSAMKVIDEIKGKGGKIVGFFSYCGGLPAPEDNDNPFGYKFSWAPRGVLLAARNNAQFLRDGEKKVIPGPELFQNYEIVNVEGAGDFESLANRDSISYVDVYSVPDVKDMYRGTFRNLGWSDVLNAMVGLDLLSLEEKDFTGKTHAEFVAEALGVEASADLRAAVAAKAGIAADSKIIEQLAWLGLFESTPIADGIKTRLDVIAAAMLPRLQYKEGQRDMIAMKHRFIAEYPDRTEYLTSTLVVKGDDKGNTAMAMTVSTPVAIATHLVLEGKFTKAGITIPTIPELYIPILEELATLGVVFTDKVEKVVLK